jgi:hypothetical protein
VQAYDAKQPEYGLFPTDLAKLLAERISKEEKYE